MGDRCVGSQTFPTSFDGEWTCCDQCGRQLRLGVNGKVPTHRAGQPKAPKLLPRGESVVDGRRCGDA